MWAITRCQHVQSQVKLPPADASWFPPPAANNAPPQTARAHRAQPVPADENAARPTRPTPNQALIIGPYSPDLADPIGKAAGTLQSNMAAGRTPDDVFLLLASVPYREIGVDRARRTQVALFVRLCRRGGYAGVPATGGENASPDCGAELGEPQVGIALRDVTAT